MNGEPGNYGAGFLGLRHHAGDKWFQWFSGDFFTFSLVFVANWLVVFSTFFYIFPGICGWLIFQTVYNHQSSDNDCDAVACDFVNMASDDASSVDTSMMLKMFDTGCSCQ